MHNYTQIVIFTAIMYHLYYIEHWRQGGVSILVWWDIDIGYSSIQTWLYDKIYRRNMYVDITMIISIINSPCISCKYIQIRILSTMHQHWFSYIHSLFIYSNEKPSIHLSIHLSICLSLNHILNLDHGCMGWCQTCLKWITHFLGHQP